MGAYMMMMMCDSPPHKYRHKYRTEDHYNPPSGDAEHWLELNAVRVRRYEYISRAKHGDL